MSASLQSILARMQAIAAEDRQRAETGPLIRVEFAAQVAELAAAHRGHDPLHESGDFLDGYVAGVERAAALVRMIGTEQ